MIKRIHKLSVYLNIDQSIILTTLIKIWSLVKLPVTLILITQYLNSTDRGYWYTFQSLGALTVFAEMGFTSIVVQFISHEFAHLKIEKGEIVGNINRIDRLASLFKFVIKRYLYIIPLSIVIILLIGLVFFPNYLYVKENIFKWFLYAISGGLALVVSLIMSILQGLNKVEDSLLINLFSGIISTLVLWLCLYFKLGLWSLGFSGLSYFLICTSITLYQNNSLISRLFFYKINKKHDWGNEINSLQLKYSISWIAGYFIFSFIVPVTMYFNGPIIAGKIGITIAVASAILQLAHSWVSNKTPLLNILISKNKAIHARLYFNKINRNSIFFFILASAVFVIFLESNFINYKDKFSSTNIVVILLLAEFGKLVLGNWAIFLRAFKTEPYLKITVINSISTIIAFVVLLKYYNSLFYALILFMIIQYISLFYGYKIFIKKIRCF